ncbi:MAG: class A beta-lactamase [Gemmatimonadaceae bacterium]|nr:class A beta-lactamase [Gloeobacterales cyanobacterium ES-bin-141]
MTSLRVSLGRVVLFTLLVLAPLGVVEASKAELTNRAVDTQQPGQPQLQQQLAGIASKLQGRAGVAVLHIESGRKVVLNGNDRFPMASVYKFPIAIAVLDRVDRGEIRLDERLTVRASDLRPASQLAERPDVVGSSVPVRELLELMLQTSDNTASDLLLKRAGGPQAASEQLQRLGVRDIRIDRPELELIADSSGVERLPPEPELTLAKFEQLLDTVPASKREAAVRAYAQDPRDTATPEAMLQLLVRVQQRQVLKPESNQLLLDIMEGCKTGAKRIRGRLPATARVAHKTGTNGGSANDAGIITLPGNRGHLAVVVFVDAATASLKERERVIAEVAGTTYDFFAR